MLIYLPDLGPKSPNPNNRMELAMAYGPARINIYTSTHDTGPLKSVTQVRPPKAQSHLRPMAAQTVGLFFRISRHDKLRQFSIKQDKYTR